MLEEDQFSDYFATRDPYDEGTVLGFFYDSLWTNEHGIDLPEEQLVKAIEEAGGEATQLLSGTLMRLMNSV